MLSRLRQGGIGGMAVLALGAAMPAASALPGKIDPRAPQSADAAIARADALAGTGDCAGVLRLLDPLVAHEDTPSGPRFAAQLLRMPCLAAVGRGGEVPPVLAELKARAPRHPLVLGFQVFADAQAGHVAQAADQLAALADTGSPALQLMPGSLWRALAQQLTAAGDATRRERTALALARAGWTPEDSPDLAENLAMQGIAVLLGEDEPDQARALLKRVVRPSALWGLAIERRYAALWPAIEARLGPASGAAADRYARAALDGFAIDTASDRARLEAVRGFMMLGRGADVIATAAPVAVAPGMGEDRVEIVVDEAEARAATGDQAGGIARLEPFARLDLATTPEATAAIISLAEALHEAGRYADEFALVDPILRRAATPFSPFGRAWLRRNQACALGALGRAADAKVAGDQLEAAAKDNEAAATEGLLCLGRDDEAAAVAIAGLATPDGADRLADQFQPVGAIVLHPPSKLRAMWARLLARKEVAAAFSRAARILPEPLWPAVEPRAIPAPAAPSADDPLVTT